MARGGQRELILEQRHLLGVFFGIVLLAAIAFASGFVIGRKRGEEEAAVQYASVAAAMQKPDAETAEGAGPEAKDLSFYKSVEENTAAASNTATTAKPPASRPAPTPASSQPAAQPAASSAKLAKPVFLQVGAFSEEAQARSLVDRLEKLGFSSRVQQPTADKLYRVMSGPYVSEDLVASAKRRLESHGFRPLRR
jgi:cell division protein FtsN